MVKSWSRRLVLMLSVILLCLTLIPAAGVFAETRYVALGDSIGYGLTDPAGGYTVLFRNYLGSDCSYENLCVPGYTTNDLIAVIGSNAAAIRGCQAITVSIGSNNLLGPAIQSILGLYDLDMDDYDDPDGSDMLTALFARVHADWYDGGETPVQRLSRLMDPLSRDGLELNAAWVAGTAMFRLQWPIIMTRLRIRAPLSRIYVNNLYNPLLWTTLTDDRYSTLHDRLERQMLLVNQCIDRHKSLYRYRTVDIRSPFRNPVLYQAAETLPTTFNICYALEAARADSESALELFKRFCDPHPTSAGHRLIFEALRKVA